MGIAIHNTIGLRIRCAWGGQPVYPVDGRDFMDEITPV